MQFRSSDRKDKPHKNILFCLVKNKIFMDFLVSEIADSIIFGSVRGRPTCNADISVVLGVVRTYSANRLPLRSQTFLSSYFRHQLISGELD